MFWFDESLSNNFFIFEWPLRGVHKYRYYVHPTGVSVSEPEFDDPVWMHGYKCAFRFQSKLYDDYSSIRETKNPMLKRLHKNNELWRFRMFDGIVDRQGKPLPGTDNLNGKTLILVDTWFTRMMPQEKKPIVHYVDYDLHKRGIEDAKQEVMDNLQKIIRSGISDGVSSFIGNAEKSISSVTRERERLQAEVAKREKQIARLQELEAKAAERQANRNQKPRFSDGYVYLLKALHDDRLYKIGRTNNPANRLKTFGVKLPFPVEYSCLIKCDDMYALESELHTRFARNRVDGEWFTLTDDDVRYIHALAEAPQSAPVDRQRVSA